MNDQEIKRCISLFHPGAKFIATSHSNDFLEYDARLGNGYHYVTLYDETITSNFLETRNGIIVVDNSYLSSFAYNLVISWIHQYREGQITASDFNPVIKYNFKKFFSEQLLRLHNNVFSRAIFLETLIYEQQLMKPIFVFAEKNSEWAKDIERTSRMMSNLVVFHEMSHYLNKNVPPLWEEIFQRNNSIVEKTLELANDFLSSEEDKNEIIEELKCDIFGTFLCIADESKTIEQKTFTLRSVVIGYASFAVLFSLENAAKNTAFEQKKTPDNISFDSIEKSNQVYTYENGVNRPMILRAKFIIILCELISDREKIQLYGDDGVLPLVKDILLYLLEYSNAIIDTEDDNGRAMAKLVAEAFDRHEEGFQYLLLNSKVYKSNRQLETKVRPLI